jgi:hypothetical protein
MPSKARNDKKREKLLDEKELDKLVRPAWLPALDWKQALVLNADLIVHLKYEKTEQGSRAAHGSIRSNAISASDAAIRFAEFTSKNYTLIGRKDLSATQVARILMRLPNETRKESTIVKDVQRARRMR